MPASRRRERRSRSASARPGLPFDACEPLVECGDRSADARRLQRQWTANAAAAAAASAPAPRQKPRLSHSLLSQLSRTGADAGPIRWAICSQTCAGGSTAGADSDRRLILSSQSCDQIAQVRVTGQQPLEAPAGRAAQRAEGIFGRKPVAQFGVTVVHRSMQSLSRIRLRRSSSLRC